MSAASLMARIFALTPDQLRFVALHMANCHGEALARALDDYDADGAPAGRAARTDSPPSGSMFEPSRPDTGAAPYPGPPADVLGNGAHAAPATAAAMLAAPTGEGGQP